MIDKNKVKRIKRLRICLGFFLFLIFAIVIKLTYIMIIKGDDYKAIAKSVQYRTKLVMPKRGTIYDASGKELAISVPVYDMWIELSEINRNKPEKRRETVDKIYSLITKEINVEDGKDLREKLDSKEDRLILIPKMSFEDMKKIKKLNIGSIWFDEKTRRFYPYGEFLASVLGHVSSENVGLSGIENYLDLRLKGIPGKRIYLQDSNGKEISVEDMEFYDSIDGENLILNIDEVVQHHLENALLKGFQKYGGKSITGIVMETKTGNILAMASYPDYDPNEPFEAKNEIYKKQIEEAEDDKEKMNIIYKMWRNKAVNDTFEPGSPFKIITTAAALEENLTYEEEIFHDKGFIEVEKIPIHNYGKFSYGDITFQKAFEKSLNTPFIILGQRLGAKKLNSYIEAFGFGSKTYIDLPGEEEGMMLPTDKVGPVELANICFGQGISVTPIQLITAVNSMGNNGKIMKPNLINSVLDKDGNQIKTYGPVMRKQVVSEKTADKVLSFMEMVVKEGSGKAAKIDGYRVAGKTGTSNKINENGKGYSETKIMCSFVGIAPVDDPHLTVLIVLDEPIYGKTGGENAAPIAKEVMEPILKYLGINKSANLQVENTVQVPDVKKMYYNDAVKNLQKSGLKATTENNVTPDEKTIVVSTFPQPGEKIARDSNVILYLKKENEQFISMPDLSGKTKEQAEKILEQFNLKYVFTGTGRVVSQTPSAGMRVEPEDMVNIELK